MKKFIRPSAEPVDNAPLSNTKGTVKKLFPVLKEETESATRPQMEDMGRNEAQVRDQLKRDISHIAFKR